MGKMLIYLLCVIHMHNFIWLNKKDVRKNSNYIDFSISPKNRCTEMRFFCGGCSWRMWIKMQLPVSLFAFCLEQSSWENFIFRAVKVPDDKTNGSSAGSLLIVFYYLHLISLYDCIYYHIKSWRLKMSRAHAWKEFTLLPNRWRI